MKIYIINLSCAVKRREFQENQLRKLGLDYEFFDAVSIDDIDEQSHQKHGNDWKRPLDITEFACYHSHKTLWHKVIQENKPALIMEDDVVLSNKTVALLKNMALFRDVADASAYNIDILNLEVHNKSKRVSFHQKRIGNYFRMLRLYQGRVGAAAYVLYPSGAKKLMVFEKKGIAPADVFITDCYSLVNYQIEPAVAIQIENCSQYGLSCPIDITSAINKPHSPHSLKKLKYQIKRVMWQIFFLHHPRRKIILNPDDFI